MTPWATKLGSIARCIFIIDLFAGTGSYKDLLTGETTDGSPVIFARQAQRYAEKFPGRKLQVICVEKNRKNAAALQKRVGGCGSLVTVLRGSFTRHLSTIISIIGTAPALILFDPIGLKMIAADTIRPLLHRKGKTDVFMVLHFKVIHRTAGMLLDSGHADPQKHGARRAALMLDAVFGTHRWRFIAKNPRITSVEERERAYLDLYFEDVFGDRYEWLCAYPVRATFKSKVQYWLVHASDHVDAHRLMNDEIVKLEEHLYRKTYEDENALEGFADIEWQGRVDTDEAAVRERIFDLVAQTPGKTITFEQMQNTSWASSSAASRLARTSVRRRH